MEGVRNLICLGGRHAALVGVTLSFALAACTPTVQVEAPKEPITINLNVKLDAEVRVKIEEQADKDIKENPDIF
jgi:YnbE-like lipoprotein